MDTLHYSGGMGLLFRPQIREEQTMMSPGEGGDQDHEVFRILFSYENVNKGLESGEGA